MPVGMASNKILNESRRSKLNSLWKQLEQERSSFMSHWRSIADHIAPRRPRFYTEDVNRGDRRNQKIIDNTPVLAARTLKSGMMSGITSPARPWFRLTLGDQLAAEAGPVKAWLDKTTDKMNSVFLKSNLYNVLPIAYGDLGIFGTAAILIEEDFDNVIRCYSMPIGSYMLALSEKNRVEIFAREFRMSIRQVITRFGMDKDTGEIEWKNLSQFVKERYDQNDLESMIDICHFITPNDYFDGDRLEPKYKKFRSVYYEKGNYSGNAHSMGVRDEDRYLRESGYDYFPVLAPRWETTGEDVYASTCPGMEALGDIQQLQLGERRIGQAIELLVKPPMIGSSALKTTKASILPGNITYVDERSEGKGFRPAFQIDPRINELEQKQQQIRSRIERTFFSDLFLMLANSDRRQITAREIDERHEEKLLALGPVLEQLNQDLLDPLIDLTFAFMYDRKMIDEPPESLRGSELKIEYISIMQQAQKLAGLSAVERFTNYAIGLAQADPTVLDKVDTAQLIDVFSDTTSMRAGVVRSDEDVAAMREQRAQAQAQQQQVDMANQEAMAAKNLSQASTEGDNGLTRMLAQSQAGALA